ncbi:calcium-binding protein P [Lingula anatina]|uniref:Calcium-binding protein P n=1 Tax=Lingula anatina TaxID=7574 RepID=A0A1S3J0N0_LINAN|nr:calcium-binding protein P [Lingula anatina]|eukprot:XP_013404000.1 calcium-binding protein P [Lingula anatina]
MSHLPPQGGFPPPQGGFPSSQGGYTPVQGGYAPQPGYPPQQDVMPVQSGGYYPPSVGGLPVPAQQGYPPQDLLTSPPQVYTGGQPYGYPQNSQPSLYPQQQHPQHAMYATAESQLGGSQYSLMGGYQPPSGSMNLGVTHPGFTTSFPPTSQDDGLYAMTSSPHAPAGGGPPYPSLPLPGMPGPGEMAGMRYVGGGQYPGPPPHQFQPGLYDTTSPPGYLPHPGF